VAAACGYQFIDDTYLGLGWVIAGWAGMATAAGLSARDPSSRKRESAAQKASGGTKAPPPEVGDGALRATGGGSVQEKEKEGPYPACLPRRGSPPGQR
jgi:hypothetical protein